MDADELTWEQLYADLVEACSQTMPDGAFTLRQFMDDAGLKKTIARRRLMERVESGLLKTKKVAMDGNRTRIWWFAEEEDDE